METFLIYLGLLNNNFKAFLKTINRMKVTKIIVLVCSFCYSTITNAQTASKTQSIGVLQLNTITTAVPVLMICPDSRAGGMGEAGVATTADANSLHWNPSKYAFIDKSAGVSLSYTPWLKNLVPDINLAYLSGFKKLSNGQTIAGSLRYFSLGNIVFTDINGIETGQFKPAEFAVDLAYARKLSDNFSGGIALRYIYSNLTGGQFAGGENYRAGQSVAADISALYRKADLSFGDKKSAISIGLNISNIGARMSYNKSGVRDFLPANLRLGTAWDINLDSYNKLTLALDLNKLLVPTPALYYTDPNTGVRTLVGRPSNVSVAQGIFQSFGDAPGGGKEEVKEINYCGGLEYWYDNVFAIRGGYFWESLIKGNRKFLTIGFGLKYNVFHLDGAYLIPQNRQNSPLANTFRFSLGFDLDSEKGTKKKAVTD